VSQSLLLKKVRIVDTVLGEVRESSDVLVSDAHIQDIRPDIDGNASGVQELDCEGKFIIPGLFDCHTHLAALTRQPLEVQKEIYEECNLGKQYREGELNELVLPDFVRRGITQVRDMGGPVEILKSMKEKVMGHQMAGPDIFFAGPMLEMPPLSGAQMNERWPGWTVAVKSRHDVQGIVELLCKDGASCIKVFGKFENEVLESLVYHAKRSGLPVTCDPGPTFFHDIDVKKGLGSGIRCFEHAKSLWYLVLKDEIKKEHDGLRGESPEVQNDFVQRLLSMGPESISFSKLAVLADMMVDSHTLLCPTLHISKFYSEKPEVFNDKEPEKFRPVFAVLYEVGCVIVAELAKHGNRMLVGQDGYIPRFTHDEMDLLSQNGVTTAEILRGATCYAAEWLGIADMYGSIAIGKKANLAVLNENPFDDIRGTRSIFTVLKDGEIISNPS